MLLFASIVLNINVTVILQNGTSVNWEQQQTETADMIARDDLPSVLQGALEFANSTCNFERNLCGWVDIGVNRLHWERTNDTTINRTLARSGKYLFVQMNIKESSVLDTAVLRSMTYKPLSLEEGLNSRCQLTLRFFYNMFGPQEGSLHADVVESKPGPGPMRHRIVTISRAHGDTWYQVIQPLPEVQNNFYVELVVTRGSRPTGTIAVDDLSLNLDCVALPPPPNTFCEDAFAISAVHTNFDVPNMIENLTDFCTRAVPPTASAIRMYLNSEKGERDNAGLLQFSRDCENKVRPTYELLKVDTNHTVIGFPGEPLTTTQKEIALQALEEALNICAQQKTKQIISAESKAELYRLILRSYAAMLPTNND